jgi:hypothetical protein
MSSAFHKGLVSLLAVLAAMVFGCDGGGGGGGGGGGNIVGPRIGGKWTGVYEIRNYFRDEPIDVRASVKHSGDMFVLRTNLPEQGRMLTGTIDEDGEMTATDAFDGETWTTHSGPATENYLDLEDFRFDLDDNAIAVLILTR